MSDQQITATFTPEEAEELIAHLKHEIHDLDCRIARERRPKYPEFKEHLLGLKTTWETIILKLGGEL